MLDCILSGRFALVLSDLTTGMLLCPPLSLLWWRSEICEIDAVLNLERLRLIETLGRRIVLAIVSARLGISMLP
jgi:hypothetical protein